MTGSTMQAWAVDRPGPIGSHPLTRIERGVPEPGTGQVRVRVRACGVCRTDLHLAEGDLDPRRHLVVPGHEVVGVVERLGDGCVRFAEGDRIGVPWLASTCGRCRFCIAGRENLCLAPVFRGWDVDGGYADAVVVDEAYAYSLPDALQRRGGGPAPVRRDHRLPGPAAGRAPARRPTRHLRLRRIGAPHRTDRHRRGRTGPRAHALGRRPRRSPSSSAWPASAARTTLHPSRSTPRSCSRPSGRWFPPALEALDRGGTLAIAGIHLTDVPALNYERHLFEERTLRSVTANTRQDGIEFLEVAARIPVRVSATAYPMDRANEALADLADDRVNGAAVLLNGPTP